MSNPIPLEFGKFYHIYNRGNNRENIFFEERNYRYFLRLWSKYIDPIAETWAYCLLRNHFHFLIEMKESSQVEEKHQSSPSQPFSNLFNAYARTINLTYHRTGALFQRPFGRIGIDSDAYLICVITYIHQNPQKHGFVSNFQAWPYSSYNYLLTEQGDSNKQQIMFDLFGGRDHFISYHLQELDQPNLIDTLENS